MCMTCMYLEGPCCGFLLQVGGKGTLSTDQPIRWCESFLLADTPYLSNQNCTRQTPDFANFYYIIMALEEETKQVKAGGPIPIPVRTNFCFG